MNKRFKVKNIGDQVYGFFDGRNIVLQPGDSITTGKPPSDAPYWNIVELSLETVEADIIDIEKPKRKSRQGGI